MENLNNVEQLDGEIISADVNEQIIEDKGVTEHVSPDSSTFGKFKDATSLLNAYNNLEKEFTKKSQKLSELTKQGEQNIDTNKDLISSESLPIFKQINWQTKVNQFFQDNPDAKSFSKDIANILLSDNELAKNSKCLDYAYALVELKNKIKPADLMNDPNFIKDILANENIKQKIIAQYLNSVSQSKHNVKFISGEPKSISPTRPSYKPKTIQEASNVLKKLLQI